MIFMYLYSSGPKPISSTPFGEITAGIVMGPVIVLISYYIQAGLLDIRAILTSIPIALLIGSILMANNIRDILHDIDGGRKTLPIVIGRDRAINVLKFIALIANGIIIFLAIFGSLPLYSLITLLSIPLALQGPMLFSKTKEPAELQGAFKKVSQTLIVFSALLFLSFIP
jgi:1,4-dihydroxy-2-naphthoate octaprenyltransferase